MKPLIGLTDFPQGWIGRERPLAGRHGRVKTTLLPPPHEALEKGGAPVHLS